MAQFQNIAGQRFGRLLVLDNHIPSTDGTKWLCRCDCGVEKYVSIRKLRNGHTISCGCFNKEKALELNYIHGDSRTGERLYSIWRNMKARCRAQSGYNYNTYGARGIKVCSEWENSYTSFKNWALANGYSDELTLDRIDGNKGYFPENCRWATTKEQSLNRRTTKLLTFNGKTQYISEWAEDLGISPNLIYTRLSRGWELDKVLSPKKYRNTR